MGKLGITQRAAVVMLVLTGVACRRGDESKSLAALDGAYRAGVITRSEYDAKKAALASLAALDKARDAGLLTPAEYQERKQRLSAARQSRQVNHRGTDARVVAGPHDAR